MDVLIAALVFVGLSVFLLSFNIIFRKNGKFPNTEIGHNKEMRKRGIRCAKDDERRMWRKKKGLTSDCAADDCESGGCSGCSYSSLK